jgi:hypothetical protein
VKEARTAFSIWIFLDSCLSSCHSFPSPHCQDKKSQAVLRAKEVYKTLSNITKKEAEVTEMKLPTSLANSF